MSFTGKISGTILRIAGWKVKGEKPKEKKYIIIAAPHTSNWDFPLARLTNSQLKIDLKLLMKESWFFFPLNYLLKYLGVVSIDRSKPGGLIDHIANLFATNDEFIFAIAPEGTRSYTEYWKTGFYHIALKAQVPILLSYLDYGKKTAGVGPMIYPSGDALKDFEEIMSFYRSIQARFPKKFNQYPRLGKK
jgi:1-acyl-sn-glycerol-3-phosphate acyltransferase